MSNFKDWILVNPSNFIRIIRSSEGQSIFDILKVVFSTTLSLLMKNDFNEYWLKPGIIPVLRPIIAVEGIYHEFENNLWNAGCAFQP